MADGASLVSRIAIPTTDFENVCSQTHETKEVKTLSLSPSPELFYAHRIPPSSKSYSENEQEEWTVLRCGLKQLQNSFLSVLFARR